MGQLARITPRGLSRQDARSLSLFEKTVGKELRGAEIDEAVQWCEVYKADPFVRDIYFFVFDAKKDTRRVVPVLSIGLYRKQAERTGNYRPSEEPPLFTYDENLKGPANPLGIVDCTVKVWKWNRDWFPTTERLRWDERAPIIETGSEGFEYVETGEVWEDSGRPKKKKVPRGDKVLALDPGKTNWRTMPETMLAKCVEASALRRAFPEGLSGSYADGELDQAAALDLSATEILESEHRKERFARIGGTGLTVDWCDGKALDIVSSGKFGDRVLEWIKSNKDEPDTIKVWLDRNRHAMKEYWALDPNGALAVKAEIEKVEANAQS